MSTTTTPSKPVTAQPMACVVHHDCDIKVRLPQRL